MFPAVSMSGLVSTPEERTRQYAICGSEDATTDCSETLWVFLPCETKRFLVLDIIFIIVSRQK